MSTPAGALDKVLKLMRARRAQTQRLPVPALDLNGQRAAAIKPPSADAAVKSPSVGKRTPDNPSLDDLR